MPARSRCSATHAASCCAGGMRARAAPPSRCRRAPACAAGALCYARQGFRVLKSHARSFLLHFTYLCVCRTAFVQLSSAAAAGLLLLCQVHCRATKKFVFRTLVKECRCHW